MIRWKQYIDELPPCSTDEDYRRLHDFIFAFFQNCYHLADWLKIYGLTDAKSFAATNRYLGVCRGLTNGLKHYQLDHKKYDYNQEHYRTFVQTSDNILTTSSTGNSNLYPSLDNPIIIEPPKKLDTGDCIVVTPEETFKTSDLILSCIDAWNRYLKDNGLKPPPKE